MNIAIAEQIPCLFVCLLLLFLFLCFHVLLIWTKKHGNGRVHQNFKFLFFILFVFLRFIVPVFFYIFCMFLSCFFCLVFFYTLIVVITYARFSCFTPI